MLNKPQNNRLQLNIRLEKFPQLLDDVKRAASNRNVSSSEFVVNAILTALGKPTITTPIDTTSLDAIKSEIDQLIDTKLDKRLEEFEQRLLAQFRANDSQPPPEELIEDIPEIKPEIKPNYQAVRDRILKSLTTGRGRIAPSAPQYKSAVKALDRFISEIETDPKVPPKE